MSRVLADLKAFALQYIRNPIGAFFTFAFPVFLLLLFGAIFMPSEAPEDQMVEFLIQDLDGTNTSAGFIDTLNFTAMNQTGTFNTYVDWNEYQMHQDILNEHGLTAALVIPAGFERDLQNGTPAELTLYADSTATSYSYTVDTLDRAERAFEAGLPPGAALDRETVDVEIDVFVFIDFFLPGIIAMSVMLNCLMILSSISAEYWSHGYFKLLRTTPLRKWEWILSKLIWYTIVMAVSIAVMIAIAMAAFGVEVSFTPLALVLIVSGTLMFSAIGILIGAASKNSDTAAGIANGVGQPMMFLSGIFWQLEDMPAAVQYVSKIFPLTYMGAGLRETMIYGDQTAAAWNTLVVVILTVVFFVLASKVISWKEK